MNRHAPLDRFFDARFGLFVHWGLYSVLGGEWKGKTMDYIGEWIQSRYRIPNAEYARLAQRLTATHYDPDEWVRVAEAAGMRYIVVSVKHHEGFAMYHSRVSRFNIVDASPYGQDPLEKLAQACANRGIGLGLYYSQDLDWHEPNGGDPGPNQPKNFGMSWGNDWDFPDYGGKDFSVYFESKVKPQLQELLTQYGPICEIWFDCPRTISREQSTELRQLVGELQPDCLVNSRIGHGLGDFCSMDDNQVPSGHVEGGWETPATLNDTWGFKLSDHNWKSAGEVLGVLAGLASKNVNYLLTIGPRPDGRFPDGSVEVLEHVAEWMHDHSEAVHGTRQSPFPCDLPGCRVTQRHPSRTSPARLYLMFQDWPGPEFKIRGLSNNVLRAWEMTRPDEEIAVAHSTPVEHKPLEVVLHLPEARPDTLLPTVVLELDSTAKADQRLMSQHGGEIMLPAQCARMHPDIGTVATAEEGPVQDDEGGTTGLPRPKLEYTGIIVDWFDADFWAEWDLYVDTPATYVVEVITSARFHSRPWAGGHVVRIETEGSSVQAQLEEDAALVTPETRYYAQAVSQCGELAFDSAGLHKLALRPIDIRPNEDMGLALVAVRLRPSCRHP